MEAMEQYTDAVEGIEETPIRVKGMFRVVIAEDGKFVGDSGYRPNIITNEGFRNFIVRTMGAQGGSATVSHVTLGSGGLANATDTALPSEIVGANKRAAVTAATSATSKAMQFTATFDSANSFVDSTYNISNIGLVNSVTAGSLFAGNTFASSSVATNQSVYVTYNISFT